MSEITKVEELVGEVLTYIDIDPENNIILLTTESGREIKIYHRQDCCESVKIESTDGEWRSLLGFPITRATREEVSEGDPVPECPDSWMRTTLTFHTSVATVISRWIDESNGYYSESVDLEEITKPL